MDGFTLLVFLPKDIIAYMRSIGNCYGSSYKIEGPCARLRQRRGPSDINLVRKYVRNDEMIAILRLP